VTSRSGPYAVYGPVNSMRMFSSTTLRDPDVEVFVIPNGLRAFNSSFAATNHSFGMFLQLLDTTSKNLISLDEDGFIKFELLKQKTGLHDDQVLGKALHQVLEAISRDNSTQVLFGPGGLSHPELDPRSLQDVQEYTKGLKNPYNGTYFSNLLMNHFGGTVPLGKSVEERTLLIKGTSNVHVVDACLIPDQLKAHPIWTIMMVAERASDIIANQIRTSEAKKL